MNISRCHPRQTRRQPNAVRGSSTTCVPHSGTLYWIPAVQARLHTRRGNDVKKYVLLFLACILFSLPAHAQVRQGVEQQLSNPLLETRAHALYKQLRCVVCQNQSIEDSNADIARDLRTMVRHRLETGASDQEIIAYIHERYGDFVLMKPPLKPLTWLLWFGPFMVLLLGAFLAFRHMGKPDESDFNSDSEQEEENG